MLDAHLHFCENTDSFNPSNLYFVNSVSPKDWKPLSALASSDFIFPFYGIHPWKVDAINLYPDWKEKLAEQMKLPSGIGEIGLDKALARKNPRCNIENQIQLFRSQLELAFDLKRPLSFHIVRAWDLFFEEIKRVFGSEKLSVPALIHAFHGSAELANRLIRLGTDLSFGPIQDSNISAFLNCPPEHRLLESDSIQYYNADILIDHYRKSAELLKIPMLQLVKEVENRASIYTHLESYR